MKKIIAFAMSALLAVSSVALPVSAQPAVPVISEVLTSPARAVTAEELAQLPPGAVRHQKRNPYGVEAMVQRSAVPAGITVSPISMEELFVFMAKEAR